MIIQLTIPGSPPIVASMKEEDNNYMYVEYPIVFMKDEAAVYTIPYLPFAESGKVCFSRSNVITVSKVHKEIEKYYKIVVKEFKSQKFYIKEPSEETPKAKIPDFKPKTFH